VRQGRHGLGLTFEAPERCGVPRKRRRQDLDRDVAIELVVARTVDLTHAAFAEFRDDLV